MPAPIKSETVTNMHNRKLKADTSEKQAGILYPLLAECKNQQMQTIGFIIDRRTDEKIKLLIRKGKMIDAT